MYGIVWASLVAHMMKNLPRMQGTRVQPLGQEDRLGREWLTPPIFFPGEFHAQRSLAGYSPWDYRELDTIGTTNTHTHTHKTTQL